MEDKIVTAVPGGVQLRLEPPGREPVVWTVPIESATNFWEAWWRAISAHFPDVSDPPEDRPLPIHYVTGEARLKTQARSDGLVRLSAQPYGLAGIGFDLRPEEARELARHLLDGAETVERDQKPN